MWIDFYIVIGPIISYACVITPLVLQVITNSEVRLCSYTDLRLWRGYNCEDLFKAARALHVGLV